MKKLKSSTLLLITAFLGTFFINSNAFAAADNAGTSKLSNVVSDSSITTKVKAKFLTDSEVDGLGLHVETVNGVVTLSGNVTSEHMRDRAIELANRVDYVKDVKSNIIVNNNAGIKGDISDAAITAKVKSKFITDKNIKSLSIHVETENGRVTLTGEVPDKSTEIHAVKLTKQVDGVKEVTSNLKINK
jgi:hyperosmotically inducible protein